MVVPPGLSLSNERWMPVDFNRVVYDFLKAEWHQYPVELKGQHLGLVESPKLGDGHEDQIRLQLLTWRRRHLLSRIPGNTVWFAVSHLRKRHYSQLLAINHHDWRSPDDQNELLKVAVRRPEPMKSHPSTWATPILWGHSMSGPFTILEGNHRLTALAGSPEAGDYPLPVYIGISVSSCYWHLPDHVERGG